jgi:hypothetical protein
MENNEFKSEWCLLQNQFDSYEKHSLYIKLVSVVVLLASIISGVTSFYSVPILFALWLQDAIWKTFQSRIEVRLLEIEKNILIESTERTFQFNSEFHKVRLSGVSLVNEYVRQSIRPTVAYPYIILILILLVNKLL